MTKIHLLAFCLLANLAYTQKLNYTKAPNSYIYDVEQATINNYSGLYIPVRKAYDMWAQYEYLKTSGASTPIPPGQQTATLHWEDVPGLVQSVSIEPGATPSDSKIKVQIQKGRGKGNAVVAFKVDGVIYWSWHVWVTDNPTNGVTYGHGNETDINGNPVAITYMDRNLGAVSYDFLGHDWHKSGGLMYEWGRKDPFPPLIYKDAQYYAVSGEVGELKHPQVDPVNTIPVKVRPYNEIEKNMKYSVNNPMTYIINTDTGGNWFSSSRYKVPGASPSYVTWDLWSDNAKGANSNGNSSNTALSKESRSYELKSELDPCPSGWRIPSYYGRETQNNNLAFFGKKGDWNNADTNVNNRQLFPDAVNPHLNGVKVYPGLGMDFGEANGGERNIGLLPVPGAYVYYPNSVSPNAPVGVMFQDNAANGGWWSSTYAYDGARIFSMISDPHRNSTSVGLHAVFNNQTNPTRSGNAVRCMKDPNLALIGDFSTEYITANQKVDVEGLNNPNSYIITNQTMLAIPVNKAFAVYSQVLTDGEKLPVTNLVARVLWTTDPGLVKSVSIMKHTTELQKSFITVSLNPQIKGNAVISLHQNSIEDPVLWSWHLWSAEEDPTKNTISYTTETPLPVQHNFINATQSKLPPLTTVFMDRNLGAISADIESGKANGLHYQWGRKDPIPNFVAGNSSRIFIGVGNNPAFPPVAGGANNPLAEINGTTYDNTFTVPYNIYSVPNSGVNKNMLYAVQNPLKFMYRPGIGNIYDGGNHYANDLSKVRDWVSDEKGKAAERWGHGGKKSPFDPCPEGWRVPDVSLVNLYNGSKGSSPWYNGYRADAYGKPGVIQDQWHSVGTYYGGTVHTNGWKFENSTYSHGHYPNDGIRGELGDAKMTLNRSGVWTAAMADLDTGFALAMQFQGDKMQTGTGVYPQAGLSVRCAKDEKRLLGTPAQATKPHTPTPSVPKVTPVQSAQLQVYPNPFREIFNITQNASYEIYDFSGKLLQQGKSNNQKVNASGLQKGNYLLKLTLEDGTVASKKLIKE